MRDLIVDVLDNKYQVDQLLGKGGMGEVYRATHLGTKRTVAVKVIHPQLSAHDQFVARFRREAEAAGRLRHPNVVDVTDFGIAQTGNGPVAYLVMEYLDGCTLAEIVAEEGALPIAWVIDILEQVCAAVEEAHRAGIIHRDLKPDNIWLEPNQRGGHTVKVLDFGIAKLEDTVAHEAADPARAFAELQGYQARPTYVSGKDSTVAIERPLTMGGEAATIALAPENNTGFGDAATIADGNTGFNESRTAILSPKPEPLDQDSLGTKLISQPEADRESDAAVSTGDLHD